MSKTTDWPDHGSFELHSEDEREMVLHIAERAQKNLQKPGHAWGRLSGSRTVRRRTEEGAKFFHVDLHTNRLTITEEWRGRETARKTVPLAQFAGVEIAWGPDAPPDPGPATPTFYRLPFSSAEVLSVVALRDWVMVLADEDVFELSVLRRRIRLFGEGFQEVVTLPQPFGANVAPGTGATLRSLWARPGVARRFVEGWFESEDGRGTAWILEASERSAWWVAMRTFDRRPGMIGRWTSAWSQRSGSGPEGLGSSLRSVLVPPEHEQPIEVGQPRPPAAPKLRMYHGSLQPTEVVPATAEAVADRIGCAWEAKLALGASLEEPELTVFRGHEWEIWQLGGEFPTGLDDIARAISARGEPPTSVALVRMGLIRFDGEMYRALVTQGEAQGRRRIRAMLVGVAPAGTDLGQRPSISDCGEVGADGWIGIAPITEMPSFTVGAGEA